MGKLRVRGRTNRKADECRKPVGSPVYRRPAVRAEVGANACPAGRWSLVFLRVADHAYPIARIESADAVRCASPTLAFDAVTRDHEPGWSGKFSTSVPQQHCASIISASRHVPERLFRLIEVVSSARSRRCSWSPRRWPALISCRRRRASAGMTAHFQLVATLGCIDRFAFGKVVLTPRRPSLHGHG
jgi:hypothetical protein